jgi:hypothetical protein
MTSRVGQTAREYLTRKAQPDAIHYPHVPTTYTDAQVAEAVKQGREFLDDCFPMSTIDIMDPDEVSDLAVLVGCERHWDGGLIDLVSACHI